MSDSEVPSDIEEAATKVVSSLLPAKSRIKYELAYGRYEIWCAEKKVKNVTNEKVLLAYFENLSTTKKPSSLWAYYSMLRSVILVKKNVDISKYTNLIVLLKRKCEGYRPKKSKILSKQDIARYLQEANDYTCLMKKVALIIGIAGACRREELTKLLLNNVTDEGQCFRFVIPFTKTNISREFFVTSGGIEGIDMVEIIRKYILLRPLQIDHDRFFVFYKNGKCTKQAVGINTFGSLPKNIASFLNLSSPEQYTGHCFRRSSASLLADNGADILTVKRHGGWRSNTVAEGYIEGSEGNKKRIASNILGVGVETTIHNQELSINSSHSSNQLTSGINFTNCNECVVNIYNK